MRRGASPGIRTPVAFCALLLLAACGNGAPAPGPADLDPGDGLAVRLEADGVLRWRTAVSDTWQSEPVPTPGVRLRQEGVPSLHPVLDDLPADATWRLALQPDTPWHDVARVLATVGARGGVVFDGADFGRWTYTAPPPPPPGFDGRVHAYLHLGHERGGRVLRLHANGTAWVQRRGCGGSHGGIYEFQEGWAGVALTTMQIRLREILDVLEGDASKLVVQIQTERPGGDDPTAADVLGAWAAVRDLGIEQVELQVVAPRRRRVEGSVDDALRWLCAHQSPDGRWAAAGFVHLCDGQRMPEPIAGAGHPDWDVPGTALGLLAFLGAGYSDRGRHPFAHHVSRAIAFLESSVDADGSLEGRGGRIPEAHAIVTLALIEAYVRTRNEARLPLARAALGHLPRAFEAAPGDPLAAVWTSFALRAARRANDEARSRERKAPFGVPEHTIASLRTAIEAIEARPGTRDAALALCGRVLLGEDPRRSAVVQTLAQGLTEMPPRAGAASVDPWRRLFGTYGLFHVGGKAWKSWGRALRTVEREDRGRDGSHCCTRGTWGPFDAAAEEGGLVAWTAVCCICFEVYYRYDGTFCVR